MTYIDTPPNTCPRAPAHSWGKFARQRLEWLYGPERAYSAETRADIARWNALGRKEAA